MKKWNKALQIGFTYIGTMVGAGFATGQEIIQFFSRYGWLAVITIMVSSVIFIKIGTKMMLLAREVQAETYEDLNKVLFGNRFGSVFSFFMGIVLFGTTGVMLAGAGSVFSEHLGLHYQLGLCLTLAAAYIVLIRGMDGILAVNSFIVPVMIIFTVITVLAVRHSPGAANWVTLDNHSSNWKVWFSPFLYAALNLSLAQAVLVPIGSKVNDPSIIRLAGCFGGIGMGILLMAGHFALSTQMPGIGQFEIPMAFLIHPLGRLVQLLFLLVIYAEIFTTLIADAFGLSLQIRQHLRISEQLVLILIFSGSYWVSQIGFSTLVSTLYPMFGAMSLGWLAMMFKRKLS